jgi:hypothetical protein
MAGFLRAAFRRLVFLILEIIVFVVFGPVGFAFDMFVFVVEVVLFVSG